jgi:hypothetical protein
MVRRTLVGLLLAGLAVAAAASPALADQATSDLIPAPTSSLWNVDAGGTHALTAVDIYGSQAGAVKDFVDAYRKSWTQPGKLLVDHLERYSSVLWAAFRFGESEGADKKDKTHTSYATVPGFGTGAYEVTNPPDSLGFVQDVFVFTQGDYLAVILNAAYDATPDHTVLMDQASAQLAQIPVPVGEYNSIGSGVMTTLGIVVGVLGVVTIVVGVVVLFVVLRSRRSRPGYAPVAAGAVSFSTDRRYWWDGQAWQDATARIPPGASRSPDGEQWWDGAAWRPLPPT